MQQTWLYRPPTWHPRPLRRLPLTKTQPGTLALSAAGYEIGDGNSPTTMAVEASVSFNVAVYPASQWPLTAATLTVTADTTDANGNLSDITNALLTPGSSYRVLIERVSDGAVWITEMTAV
jgi:hypothetical protein